MVKNDSTEDFPNIVSNSFYQYLGDDDNETKEKLSISHNSMIGTSSAIGYYFNREEKVMERRVIKV